MAINLATKYEPHLLQAYNLASVITGKTNTDYDFAGVNSINILTAVTQDLNNYTRSGTWRYGNPAELQDTKDTLTLTQDKSFSITIDRGNNTDQMNAKKSGEVVKAEIGEKVTPYFDKYALNVWATNAGTTVTQATVTKDTVLDLFINARKHFVNHKFPLTGGNNYAYVTTTTYAYLLRNPEFISVEKLGQKVLSNGVVGKCMMFPVVEVPDDYLPTGCHALFAHKKSVLAPTKISELFVRNDVPGISGTLIEGRYYGDAFVLDALAQGVYAVNAS